MPLNATNFVVQGPIKSADMKQFVDLFTGVMNDQPVTFKNAVMIGGSQGSSTPPLKLYGVAGQTGNLIELYPTSGSATATFGFGAVGNFAWGPGSPAANDTFLSRIALQNGHATDTAGILINPYLEVMGNIKADGWVFTNQATLTGPIGTPFLLQINQDLTVNRHTRVGDTLFVGTVINATNQTITTPGYAALQLRTVASGGVFISSYAESYVSGNLYNNLTGWHRSQGSVPASTLQVGTNAINFLFAGASAPDPVSAFVNAMTVDLQPSGTAGRITINGNLLIYGTETNAIMFRDLTHYMQYAPAGQLSLLQWSHDFKATGYLEGGTSVRTPTLMLPDGNDTVTSDGTNLILRSNATLYFQKANGANIAYLQGGGNLTLLNGDINCGSVSLLQGSNQVIYWRDGGHYLQYAPAGDLNTLIFTHTFQASRLVARPGGGANALDILGAATMNSNSPGVYALTLPNVNDGTGHAIAHQWVVYSSKREKQNIRPLQADPMSVLDAIRAVRYEDLKGVPSLGFIAEQVVEHFPELVDYLDGEVVGMDYGRTTAVLWAVVDSLTRGLDARIKRLEGIAA